jgi:hypothetical protein
MEYKIPKDLRDALLQYLANRPYGEVAKLIAALSTLPLAEKE